MGMSLITGGDLLRAFVGGTAIFTTFLLLAALAGYLGLRALPVIMSGGLLLAIIAMFFFVLRPGDTGWGGIAAVAALVQISVLSIITGVFTELGVYAWSFLERRKSPK
jgi:hypothetical protein